MPIAIKAELSIQREEEKRMAEVYADERRIYVNVITINDKDEEYEKEMTNAVKERKIGVEERK